MPETSEDGLPGQQPSAQAASRPPAWRRRSVLIPGIAAIAAVATAAALLWHGSGPPEYTAMPPPCTLVTAATLARYLPGATGTPLGPSVPGGCRWLSTSGRLGQRELVVTAAVFTSSAGVTIAREGYEANAHAAVQAPGNTITFTVTRHPMTGLGDEAVAQVFQPGKNVVPPVPQIEVNVWSRNADILVTLNINQAGSDPLPSRAQLLSETIAIARDVLGVIAHP